MGDLTVANCLGMLQEDPLDSTWVDQLREALTNGQAAEATDSLRLIEAARGEHERRGEYLAAGWLMEVESHLVADDPHFQVVLLKELARVRRDELMDDAGALEVYQRLGGPDSEDPEVVQAIEQLAQANDNWRQIAERFVTEARDANDARLKTGLLTRAASMLWQYGDDEAKRESDDLFDEALAADPSYGRTARLYATSLRARKRWEDVVSVLIRAGHAARTEEQKASLWLHAARVLDRNLGEKERAAEAYQQVVEHAPADAEALRFLVEFYNEREAWEDLVGLYEQALRSRLKLEDEEGVLLQLAMVHWRVMDDAEAAEPYFARLRKIDPAHPGMLEYYRTVLGAEDPERRLLTILGDAQRATQDESQELELAKDAAVRAQEAGQPDQAIEAWKVVQRLAPDHADATDALRALYRQEGKWNALVELLRHELDALPEEAHEQRLVRLRELLPIYRDELQLEQWATQTQAAIVAQDPQDTAAFEALCQTYASGERWNELIQVLSQQAEAAREPHHKVALLMRVAGLWLNELDNPTQAAKPLEAVLTMTADHAEALDLLKGIYEKKRKWAALLEVLRKEALLDKDPAAQLAAKVRMAELCTDKLHRNADAIALWKEVLEAAPDNSAALTELSRLAEREKDWATLAMLLERQAEQTESRDERVAILHRLGAMLAERLEQSERARAAWESIVEIDPDNTRARRLLRDAYVASGDWAALEPLYAPVGMWAEFAEVLMQGAQQVEDAALSRELTRRAARIYRDEMGEPYRAVLCYEHMLSLDPDCVEAAQELAPMYERESKWERLVRSLEVLERNVLPSEDSQRRTERLQKLRLLYLERLHDPEASFRWAALAYELTPSETVVYEGLEQSAQAAGAHRALVSLFQSRVRQRDIPDDERTRLRKRIAALAGEELGESEESIAQLKEILHDDPTDDEAVAVLDRLYRSEGRHEDLRELYDLRLEHARDSAEHWVLLTEVAQLEEEKLEDFPSAAERYWAIVEVRPDDREALTALERLTERLEQWDRLSGVLERRADGDLTDAERVALSVRLGELRRLHLDDFPGALQAYATAFALGEDREEAIEGVEAIVESDRKLFEEAADLLEGAYTRRGEFAKLSELLQQRLKASDSKRDKRTLRLRLAELAASELGDVEGAYRALESAFLDRPSDRDLLDRLWGVTEAAGKHETLASALATALETGDLEPQDVTELCRRIARLYDGVLDRAEDAEPFHQRVLAQDPLDEAAFFSLKELFTQRERWKELKDLYQARIAATVDGEARVELLTQLCFLFEDILDAPEDAIGAYEQLLELEPTHLPSRRALQRLYARIGRWPQLAELLRRDLDDVQGQEAIAINYELGTIREEKLGEFEPAVDCYQRVIELEPGHRDAQMALRRLMEQPEQRQRVAAILEPILNSQGAWKELTEVLEVQLEDIHDPVSVSGVLTRLGELYEDKLGDKLQAFEAYARSVTADPVDEENRRQLGRLAQDANAYRAQAKVLDGVLGEVTDHFLRTDILLELAGLWDERLEDAEQAKEVYTQLLEAEPDNLELAVRSLTALERLHAQLGDQAGLAGDLQRHIELEDDPERRSEMLARLGGLLQHDLSDLEGAIDAYRRRLEMEPNDEPTLRALEGLYQQTKQWEPLIDILQMRELALGQDEGEQLTIYRRIASIYEENLEDTESAVATYQEAVSRFGQDPECLAGLARLYRTASRWHELQDTIEMQAEEARDPDQRIALLFESAELMRLHTNDPERAFETYCGILADRPEHEQAREVLHELVQGVEPTMRVAAARTLAVLYAQRGQHREEIPMLSVIADSEDPVERLAALRRAATISANELTDVQAAFEFQGKVVRRGLDEPDADSILADYERFAEQSARWQEYAVMLDEIAPEILDPTLRAKVMMQTATVAATRLSDPDLAKKHYERLLEDQPDHIEALDALLDQSTRSQDHENVAQLLERKAELSNDRHERAELFVRQAKVFEAELSSDERAIDAFDQAVAEDDHEEAYEGLERLYAKAERWDNLSELYERKIERRIGTPADLHFKLGTLCVERLEDAWRAMDHYREALHLEEDHPATIEALERLAQQDAHRASAAEILEPVFIRRMDWPRVISMLDARLVEEADPFERVELLKQRAELQETHLEDLEGAFETYSQVVLEDPTHVANRERFSHLAHSLERWDKLADTYDTALSQIELDDADTAALAVTAAKLFDERLDRVDKAAHYYERALKFDPSDGALAARLAAAYERTEAWEDLLALYQERERFADTDAERVAILHHIARTEAEHLEARADAIDTYRRIMELAPRDDAAVEAIDALLEREERWSDLAEHLQVRIDRVRGTDVELDLLSRLGRLTHARLGDTDHAIGLLEDVLHKNQDHPQALETLAAIGGEETHALRVAEILEPIYRRSGQWQREVEIVELRLRHADDDEERLELLSKIARLHEEAGDDKEAAFDAWKRALLLNPTADAPRAALDRLSAELQNWDDYVETFDRATEAPDAAPLRASLLLRVAQVHDEERGDPRAAIGHYLRVLETEPRSESALAGVQTLYTLIGDWAGLATLLEHRIQHADDATVKVHALKHLGGLWEEELGDTGRAIEAFERALEEDASDAGALAALDRLLGATNNVDRLAEVLGARFGLEDDPEVGVELGLRLADLHETRRGDPDRAIEVLEQVARIGPGRANALDRLARVRERQGQWAELADVLTRRLAVEEHAEMQVALTQRVAEVLEHELDDVVAAIEAHQNALAISPTHEPSLQALLRIAKLADYREQAADIVEPLLRSQQRWDEVVSVLEERAGGADSSHEKSDQWMAVADVHEHERTDEQAAFDALVRVLEEQPGRSEAVERAHKLAESLGRWQDWVKSVGAQASAALEPDVAARLHALHADIAETQLDQPEVAIESYQQAVAQVGDEAPLLDALDRLYARTQQWGKLTDIVERQLQVTGTDPVALLLRLGDLRANQLGDAEAALSTFENVLEQDPANPEALASIRALCEDSRVADAAVDVLERQHRGSGDVESLVHLYDLRADRAQTDGDRVGLLREAARLWEEELRLPREALTRIHRAVVLHPHETTLLDDVERLADAAGDWDSVRGLGEEVAKNTNVEHADLYRLRLRLASWCQDRMHDSQAAELELDRALELDPTPTAAHEARVALFETQERWLDAVGALHALAEMTAQSEVRLGHLRRAAEIAQTHTGDSDLVAQSYEAILTLVPEDLDALQALCGLRRAESRWTDVVDLLERRIALERRDEPRLALKRELGQTLAGPLEQSSRAIEVYESVLEESPEDGVTFRALEQLYERSGHLVELRGLLERGFEDAASDSDRRTYGMRLAELSESALEDPAGAIGYLKRVLEADSADQAAKEALGRLLQSEGRWDEFVVLLESRVEDATQATARAEALYRLADVHESERQDLGAAAAVYQQIVEVEGDRQATLQKLAELLERLERWSDAADILERLTRVTDAPEAIETAYRLADLASTKLGDSDRVRTALETAHRLGPDSAEARDRLKRHYEEHGIHRELAQILAIELESEQDKEAQLALLRRLAAIYRDDLGDHETSTSYLERAVRSGENDREMLVPLCDLYLETGRYADAIPMLEKVIASFGKVRTKELAAHHHRLGQALESLGKADEALAAYDRAFTIDLSNVLVLRDLGKLTYARGDLTRAQKSFRALLLQRLDDNAGIAKADIYFYLGDIAAKQGDSRKAISMLERALAEDKAHQQAQGLLATLKS